MLKCTNCKEEFEVHDDQIIAWSSELQEAHIYCYLCKTEIIVKVVPLSEVGRSSDGDALAS